MKASIMKRFSRILAGIYALVLLVSCSVRADMDASSFVDFTLDASQEEQLTRTILSQDYREVLWTPGDEISLFNNYGGVRLTSTASELVASTTFIGEVPVGFYETGAPYWGLYPYRKDVTFHEGMFTTTLAGEQVAVPGTFSANTFITAGYSKTKDEMVFRNVCSGFRFKLDRDGISRVTLIANGGEPLAGRFSFMLEGSEGYPEVLQASEPESVITLDAPEGTTLEVGEWYYMVTLPSVLEQGFTLFMEGDGIQGTFRVSKPISFNRGRFISADLSSRVSYADLDTYDIVGASVRDYLDKASAEYPTDCGPTGYENSILSTSSSSKAPGSGSSSKSSETVKPVTISLDGSGASSIIFATDPLYTNIFKEVAVSSSTASVYNLIPGQLYFYKIVSGDEIVKEACVRPFGPLRIIDSNLRDLGGWTGEDGKTIRYGVLYRGDNRDSGFTERDSQLGISVDLDLRGYGGNGSPKNVLGFGEENAEAYYKEGAEIVNLNNSYLNLKVQQFMIGASSSGGGGGGWKSPWIGYSTGSTRAGSDYGVTAELYQVAIRYIIRKLSSGNVVYFHCIGGADRTGTLAFLIEALLGVAESDLSQDFELTSLCGSTRLRTNTSSYPF